MTSSAGPLVGGVATGSSRSAAINIPSPQCRGSCGCFCNCGCNDCSCSSRVDIIDPNREEYGGEGTLLGVAAQAITQPTSYTSTSSTNSVQQSSDAPVPTARTTIAPTNLDTIRDLHGRQDPARVAQTNMDRYMNEADDECPWEHFLEQSLTSDAMAEDTGLFGPMEVDGSMRNHAPLGSGEQSMLSSFMSSLSLHTPSVGLSDVVRGTGDVFGPRGDPRPGHNYLRLN